MADVAELQSQIKRLPMNQILILKAKLDELTRARRETDDFFVFDSLVHHTDRADRADEYIRELRDNDRF